MLKGKGESLNIQRVRKRCTRVRVQRRAYFRSNVHPPALACSPPTPRSQVWQSVRLYSGTARIVCFLRIPHFHHHSDHPLTLPSSSNPQGLFYSGPDIASIFQPLIPVFTALLAFLLCMEKLPGSGRGYQWFKLLGILLGAGGAILMTVARNSSSADEVRAASLVAATWGGCRGAKKWEHNIR